MPKTNFKPVDTIYNKYLVLKMQNMVSIDQLIAELKNLHTNACNWRYIAEILINAEIKPVPKGESYAERTLKSILG